MYRKNIGLFAIVMVLVIVMILSTGCGLSKQDVDKQIATAIAERPCVACTPVPVAQQPAAQQPAVSTPKVEQPAPAVPAAQTTYVSLNYDETNGDPLTPGQSQLIAIYLRVAMGSNGTQTAMEAAISFIQNEAQVVHATVKEGDTLTLPRDHAWLVWCSNATQVNAPTDVSDVFGQLRTGAGKVWIVVPFAAGVPWPSANTFSGCTGARFWSVAIH